MRIVIQRVNYASVSVEKQIIASISRGMVVFVAIEDSDNPDDCQWLAKKMVQLRIFDDEQGVMNRSVNEVGGEILIISQFTLYASTRKGNRPSYIRASKPPFSIEMYEKFCDLVAEQAVNPIQKGIFGADMNVALENAGPVTIIIDSKQKE
ncbi:MAG: D-aminoacyl-tRNA deacylase [Microbacter sp.]